MSMWQDHSLERITRLEEELAEQKAIVANLAALLNDVTHLVMLQTAKETQPYVRGQHN